MKNTLRKFRILTFLVCAITLCISLPGKAATITITTSTNWSALTGGSGPGGLPNSTDIVQVHTGATLTVNVSNAVAGTINVGGGSNNTTSTLAFNSGSVLTVTTFNINGNANRRGSVNMSSGGLLQIGGVATVTNLNTFTPGTGTIEYNAAGAQTVNTALIAVNPYNNLTLSGSGVKTVTGITVNGILSLQGTATVTGTPTYGAAATLEYRGSAAQTTGTEFPASFSGTGGVLVNNSNGVTLNAVRTISAASNLTVGNSVSNSIFSDGGFQLSCTGTLNLTSGTLSLGSALSATTLPAFGTKNYGAGTTVEFASGVAQTVAATSYPNLTFSNGGAKTTASGTLNISSNWSVSGGTATLSTNNSNATVTGSITGTGNITSGSGTITVIGNWTNSGTFTSGTGTVVYNGVSQTIAALSYYNLNINQTSGTATLGGDVNVSNTCTLTAGNVFLASNNLIIGTAGSISVSSPSATKMIIASGAGQLRKMFSANGTFTFPIGDNTGTSEYSPISLNITGSGYSSAYVAVNVSNAKNPSNASTTDFLNRYWTVLQSGITGCTATVTATYTGADISGTETSIKAAQLNGTFDQSTNPWVRYSTLGANTLSAINAPLTSGTASVFTGITGADPTVSIMGGNVTVCPNVPVALSTTVTGDPTVLYQWSPGTGLSSSTVSNPTATVATTTIYTVLITDGNGITASNTTTITIDPGVASNTPGGITGDVITCDGQLGVQYSVQPAANATGYDWTLPAGATIASGTGTRIITVDFPNPYTSGTICVSSLNSCNIASAQRCLSVKNVTSFTPAGINGDANVCPNATGLVYAVSAVDGATTYNWTLPTGMTITGGTGTRSITVDVGPSITPGPICVTVSNSCGTSLSRCKNITTSAAQTPGGISGLTSVCANLTGINWSVQPVSGAISYTWTVPTGFSIVSGQGTRAIVVDAGATPVAGNVCVTANFNCGASLPRCMAVSVSGTVLGNIAGSGFVCPGSTGLAYSVAAVNGAISYNWSFPAGITQASGGTSNSITVDVDPGYTTGSICVTVTSSCGTGAASCKTVQSIALSTPGGISGPVVVCPNTSNVVYSVQPVGGAVSYSWTLPTGMSLVSGGTTRTVTVDIGPSYTTGSICVSAMTSCGFPTLQRCLTVNEISISTPPNIGGPVAVCPGATSLTYTVAAVSGATSYSWSLPAGVTFSLGSPTTTNAISVDIDPSFTTGSICVATMNACGTSLSTCKTLLDIQDYTPGGISGPDVVCQNATGVNWSVPSVAGAASYEWLVPNGITITGGATTNVITADVSGTFTAGDIGVRAVSSCGSKSLIRWTGTTVSVNPGIPGSISAAATLCPSSTTTLSISAVDGAASYEWILPDGITFTPGPPSNTNSVSVDMDAGFTQGDVCVRAISSCGVTGYMKCQTLGSLPATPSAISGPAGVCPGETGLVYSVSPANGAVSYVWTLPAGWSITGGSGTNSITADAAAGFFQGQVLVHAVSSCGLNGGSRVLNVSANPATPGTISGPAAICNGSTGIYSVVAVAGAASYEWTLPTGLTFTSGPPTNTNSVSVDAGPSFAGGDICVAAISSCGGKSAKKCLTVGTTPATPDAISGDVIVCAGTNGLVYSIPAVSGATSYTWSVPANTSIQSGQGTNTLTLDIGGGFTNGSLCVTADAGCGASASSCITLDITPPTATSISVPANFCPGSTKTLSITPIPGAASYTWTLPVGLTEVYGNGTASITVTASPGFTSGNVCVEAVSSCAATGAMYCQSVGASAAGAPSTITSSAVVCGGSNVVFSATNVAGAGSFNWTVPGPISIISGQGTPSILASVSPGYTTGQVCVTASSGCATPGTQTCQTFSATPATPGNITGPASVCAGETGIVFNVTGQSGSVTYAWNVPVGLTITSGQGTPAITVDASGGFASGTISVNAVSPCGALSAPKTLAVGSALGTPGSMTTPAATCNNTSGLEFSVPILSGATSYVWTAPGDVTIDAGQGTNSISVSIGAVFTSGQVCVSAVSACGLPGNQRCATIRSLPNTPGGISGPTKGVCGQTNAYSIPAASGATSYTWSTPAGATLMSGQGTQNVTVMFSNSFTTGQLSVISNNTCGSSAPRISSAITGAPAQPSTVTGPATVCANSTGNMYSVTLDPNATSYLWTIPGTGSVTAGQGTNAVTVTWGTTSGSLSVYASNLCGNSPTRLFNSVVNCRLAATGTTPLIDVYPNPVQDELTVNLQDAKASWKVVLTDAAGRLVRSEEFGSGSHVLHINTASIPQGIYLLHIYADDQSPEVIRVVRQ